MENRIAGGWWREPLWLLAVGYWVWLIWACAGEWTTSEDYGYGWLVPPLALYFLWKRIEQDNHPWAQQAPASGALRGVVYAVLALSLVAIMPLEVVRQTPIHWRPILWAIGGLAVANTLAVAWLTGGRARLGVVLVPSLFMLVAIPWPTFVENSVSFPLMQVVTRWSVGLIHLLGYPATAAGTTIHLSNCVVGVEEACSGLRSLQTALMVGLAAGELTRLGTLGRMVLLLMAFVMAIAGNQVRVLMLAVAGIQGGNVAVEQLHDTAGYVVMGMLLVGVGLAAYAAAQLRQVLGRPEPGNKTVAVTPEVPMLALPHAPNLNVALLALACLAMFSAHAWFWVRGSLAAKPAAAMLQPMETAGFLVDENVPPAILAVLNPDESNYVREAASERVIGYHFYWKPRRGNANQLYHRPDRCMPGAGWRIDGEVTQQAIKIGGRDFAFNVFPFHGPAGLALLLWGSFLNGEPIEVEFNTDVYLGTANLWQFVRTGTRIHSYEVAAFIMPYQKGERPSPADVEAFANRVFAPTKPASQGG